MITKFKLYEERIMIPRRGDYIIASHGAKIYTSTYSDIVLDNFVKNNIGRISNKVKDDNHIISYSVDYENVPDNIRHLFNSYNYRKKRHYWLDIRLEDILHFSEDRKDLEIYIDVNKYNL